MDVLLIGSGGREHAIAWKLRSSPKVGKLYCAPGNGGIAQIAECVDIGARDIPGIVAFAKAKNIGLTFVAPDDPLADGLVDALKVAGCPAFGPTAAAARIEASKAFAKELMARTGIPTAKSAVFSEAEPARAYVREQGAPIVVKADGLALGKGVFVCARLEEALAAIDEIMERKAFGFAGNRVVIEEFMTGPEVSLMCFTDGKDIRPMPPAQDHKRAFDGDMGPNTGGMGAFAPSATLAPAQLEAAAHDVLLRAVRGMASVGCPFQGVLYAGLMLTPQGVKVLEFNARLGDPETQVILPLLKTDLMDIVLAIIEGRLGEVDVEWEEGAAATVVLASGGYPGSYHKGYPIEGLAQAAATGALVFHSGTAVQAGQPVTSGGRVLAVTAKGNTLSAAIESSYRAVNNISFKDCHFRRDIGSGV